jgi:tellurite resistance protein
MKYFNNLTAVESEIIRMNYLRSILTMLSNGYEASNREDIENCIWQAKELADSINENLSEEFQNLWDTVRDDTSTSWTEYDTKPLSDVIDSWIRNK